jgi:hypothetical protein
MSAALARDASLQQRVAIAPEAGRPASRAAAKLTSADVLEALHHATGMPIVADFYTRLFAPESVTLPEQPLFAALNRLADAMRLRWQKEAGATKGESAWLQFRSADFFIDRPKEVPNRLLARWSASRRRNGTLPLEDLLEIARLPDAQLDGREMAEGAREIWGLSEWELAGAEMLRPHLRFLSELTSEQRRMAQDAAGLPFGRMSLTQQQKYLSFLLMPGSESLPAPAALPDCVLRVAYTQPGAFQWIQPGQPWYQIPTVVEPTPAAALEAARRIDPRANEDQIAPSMLDVIFLYLPKDLSVMEARVLHGGSNVWTSG